MVVDLASAVKELVDNALDAHSTKIDVVFKNYGLDSLEVSDDGDGINPDDFDLLARRSSTSKIKTFEDISSLVTLGFRGEALSSLCGLANVSITTKQVKEATAMANKLKFSCSGEIVEKTLERASKGTTVTASNLFHSLPVRRKTFERNHKRDFSRAVSLLQEYAIISDRVLFTVVHMVKSKGTPSTETGNYKRTVVFRTTGTSICSNIAELYGHITSDNLTPMNFILDQTNIQYGMVAREDVENPPEEVRITGFISQPVFGKGRSATDRQHFFVNGRPCVQEKLAKAANEVYKQFNHVQLPAIICNVITPAHCLDVNVTPDKRTVLLHGEVSLVNQFRQQLYQLLDNTVQTVPKGKHPQELSKAKPAFNLRQSVLESTFTKQPGGLMSLDAKQLTALKQKESSNREIPAASTKQTQIRTEPAPRPSIRDFAKDSVAHTRPRSTRQSGSLMSYSNDPSIPEVTDMHSSCEASNEDEQSQVGSEVSCSSGSDQNVSSLSQQIKAENGIHRRRIAKAKHTTHNLKVKCNISMQDIEKRIAANRVVSRDKESQRNKMTVKALDICDDVEKIVSKLDLTVHKQDFTAMEVVGQFNLGFILVRRTSKDTGATELFVVDQHASDEKFNFERFQRDTVLNHQKLVSPKTLSLTAVEELAVSANPEIFENNGFQIRVDPEALPGQQCQLISVPYSKSTIFDESDIHELISLIREDPGNKNLKCSKSRAMFAMRACRSSIMVGQPLTKATMKKVIHRLAFLDKPWNCPHGRPTLRHVMSVDQWQGFVDDESFRLSRF